MFSIAPNNATVRARDNKGTNRPLFAEQFWYQHDWSRGSNNIWIEFADHIWEVCRFDAGDFDCFLLTFEAPSRSGWNWSKVGSHVDEPLRRIGSSRTRVGSMGSHRRRANNCKTGFRFWRLRTRQHLVDEAAVLRSLNSYPEVALEPS